MSGSRKLFIKSYGCQMNVYDSYRMTDTMARDGYVETQRPEDADLIILNTCHIRERAAEKVYSELGRIREIKSTAKQEGRNVLVAVAGCVAQAEGIEITRRAPIVDLVIGPQNIHRLPDLFSRAKHGQAVIDTEFPVEDKFDYLVAPTIAKTRTRGITAFVTVQEGCDKFCTFCVVPYTRGSEVSRPAMKIVEEVERLTQAGVAEVTLIGQNVNAYHGTGPDGRPWTLARLFERLSTIPEIVRLRYTTNHPRDMSKDLINVHRDLPKLMPFLHLPVQSGSNRVLREMKRRHGRSEYLEIVSHLRTARPDIAISSDFIVGFPGETDKDFEDTLDLIRQIKFASTFSFKYSARPGTGAAELDKQIADSVKDERLACLQELAEKQRHEFNESMRGQTLDVLFEKPGRLPGQIAGRSPYLQPVQVRGPSHLIGKVMPVQIVNIGSNSLFGEIAAAVNGPQSRAFATGAA
jgi:tRNA-2-methylthio-N6-dimethylallyladenosine synthase